MTDLSTITVSFNSAPFLEEHLLSLKNQDPPLKQIIVVDNGSQDNTLEILQRFSGIRIIELGQNLGYAAAANRGIAAADGELIMVANADTRFPADFSCRVAQVAAEHPEAGMLSPLMLRFDGQTIDSAGQIPSLSLHPREIGYNRTLSSFPRLETHPVFSVCGAATLFRRSALDRLRIDGEYYDEDFFMFWEDFDIGWRAQLLGIPVLFSPDIVIHHFRSGTLERNALTKVSLALSRPAPIRYHLLKNRYLTLIKNFRWRRQFWRLPFIFFRDLAWCGALTIRQPLIIIALARAGGLASRAWKKRKQIRLHE